MKTIVSAIALILIMAAGALWWVSDQPAAEDVEIKNARVRLVPGGGPMAGYLEIRNNSRAAIHLTAARSSAFDHVMIHRTVVSDGSARMEHQHEGVLITPGQTVVFAPRGLHLMLMRPQQELQIGDSLELVLEFEGLEPAERSASFTVVPITSE